MTTTLFGPSPWAGRVADLKAKKQRQRAMRMARRPNVVTNDRFHQILGTMTPTTKSQRYPVRARDKYGISQTRLQVPQEEPVVMTVELMTGSTTTREHVGDGGAFLDPSTDAFLEDPQVPHKYLAKEPVDPISENDRRCYTTERLEARRGSSPSSGSSEISPHMHCTEAPILRNLVGGSRHSSFSRKNKMGASQPSTTQSTTTTDSKTSTKRLPRRREHQNIMEDRNPLNSSKSSSSRHPIRSSPKHNKMGSSPPIGLQSTLSATAKESSRTSRRSASRHSSQRSVCKGSNNTEATGGSLNHSVSKNNTSAEASTSPASERNNIIQAEMIPTPNDLSEHDSIWSEEESYFVPSEEDSSQYSSVQSDSRRRSLVSRIMAQASTSVSGLRSSSHKNNKSTNHFSIRSAPSMFFSRTLGEPSFLFQRPGTASNTLRRSNRQHPVPQSVSEDSTTLDPMSHLVLDDMTSKDAETVDQAIYHLAMICHDGDVAQANREKAVYLGVHTMLLHTVQQWASDAYIQSACCSCLANLLCDNARLVGALRMLGGMEHILDTMKHFPYSGDVQLTGLSALRNLFGTEYEDNESMAKRFVVDLKGCQVIVATMREFSDDVEMQIAGLCTLDNLCLIDEELKEHVVRDGGVTAAGTALEKHPGDYRVKETALQLTKFLLSAKSKMVGPGVKFVGKYPPHALYQW